MKPWLLKGYWIFKNFEIKFYLIHNKIEQTKTLALRIRISQEWLHAIFVNERRANTRFGHALTSTNQQQQ